MQCCNAHTYCFLLWQGGIISMSSESNKVPICMRVESKQVYIHTYILKCILDILLYGLTLATCEHLLTLFECSPP